MSDPRVPQFPQMQHGSAHPCFDVESDRGKPLTRFIDEDRLTAQDALLFQCWRMDREEQNTIHRTAQQRIQNGGLPVPVLLNGSHGYGISVFAGLALGAFKNSGKVGVIDVRHCDNEEPGTAESKSSRCAIWSVGQSAGCCQNCLFSPFTDTAGCFSSEYEGHSGLRHSG